MSCDSVVQEEAHQTQNRFATFWEYLIPIADAANILVPLCINIRRIPSPASDDRRGKNVGACMRPNGHRGVETGLS